MTKKATKKSVKKATKKATKKKVTGNTKTYKVFAKDGDQDSIEVVVTVHSKWSLTNLETEKVARSAARQIFNVVGTLPFTDFGPENTSIKRTR